MRKALFALTAAAIALTTAAPAAANTGGASVEAIYEAGACIVQRDRDAALTLMQTLPIENIAVELDLPSETARSCADGMTSASGLLLRGGIAQALFFRDFGGFGQEPARSRALFNLDLPVQDSPEGSLAVELYRLADCVVRNDVERTERLLSSRVGSRNEANAISGLQPYMRACAPAGMQMEVSTSQLRSAMAQSAYQSMYRYWTRDLTSVGH